MRVQDMFRQMDGSRDGALNVEELAEALEKVHLECTKDEVRNADTSFVCTGLY